MASIYALYSCRDGLVRYVGMTTGTIDKRFVQHQRGPYVGIGIVRTWMQGEWRDGFPVRTELLEWCEIGDLQSRETFWINRFDKLLNTRKYYRPQLELPNRAPTANIPAIAAYMRNHIFNFEGRHGIHYRRSIDMFFVLVPDRNVGLRPLVGDELPGGSRAMWFSDLARALNARERFRSFTSSKQWPRDRVI